MTIMVVIKLGKESSLTSGIPVKVCNLLREEERNICMFSKFCGIKPPTVANIKLPIV